MDSYEQVVVSVRTELSNVRTFIDGNPNQWRSCTDTVRTCVSNINTSHIMLSANRLDEKLWLINEVQSFAYFDADSGAITELASWCEREWNRVLGSHPTCVEVLKGLGQAWLSKAQYLLAKIHQEEGSPSTGGEEDDAVAEKRRHTANYVEARAVLMPAVDFFGRAVQHAQNQHNLTGELLTLRAEACMSLGNVSTLRNAQQQFKDAVIALRAAEKIPGYALPHHLSRYLRENEYILSI